MSASALSARYGNVTKASVGTIQRALLTLDTQGGQGRMQARSKYGAKRPKAGKKK